MIVDYSYPVLYNELKNRRIQKMTQKYIRPPMEITYAQQLNALSENDHAVRPENWRLSPEAVRTFILGSRKPIEYSGGSIEIDKKYLGNDALVERCIITLTGIGEPGTAKTKLSELFSTSTRTRNFRKIWAQGSDNY